MGVDDLALFGLDNCAHFSYLENGMDFRFSWVSLFLKRNSFRMGVELLRLIVAGNGWVLRHGRFGA